MPATQSEPTQKMQRASNGYVIEPRGPHRESAARYIGISPSKFDELVKDGRMPKPREIDRRKVWDRLAVDAAFEDLPSEAEENAWDQLLADGHN